MMLTQSELKRLLDYDPATGLFTWRLSRSRLAKAGEKAGGPTEKGYWRIWVNGKFYSAHRLAFLWVTGVFPENEVDHINGVRSDNRWCNLRKATREENMQNRADSIGVNNAALLGVSKNTHGGKFSATIQANGRRQHLGSYDDAWEAHVAYLDAKDRLHKKHARLK